MTRYKLIIQYRGNNFHGSQFQPNLRTVQGELNKAISTLTNQDVTTIFSGRTDSGVHAKEQVVHFDLNNPIILKKFLFSLNCVLPDDIQALRIVVAPKGFHSQMSAKFRHYQFKIRNSKFPKIFEMGVFHHPYPLNCERMNEAIHYLVGTHDFSAFKSVSENPAKICEIYEAKVSSKGSLFKIDIVGNRFLYNMVRTIVGTLLMIEKDNLPPSAMRDILNSKDRKLAGPVANSNGLFLLKVGYNSKNRKAQ